MNTSRLSWANDVRAVAVIAVITLHVASTISEEYPALPKSFLFTSIFFHSASCWGVPLFIMLSGSFALEHYDGQLKKFFTKLFYRIVLPFLFWSAVYLLFFSWSELINSGKTVTQLISFIGQQFLSGTASHLWYVYIIVSLYLTFPFLSRWTKLAVEKEYIYFLSLWIIFIFLDPYLSRYDTSFEYSYFSGYLGYIILGNYLFKTNRKIKGWLLLALFMIGFLYTALRTYFISIHKNESNETFMDNLSLNVCLMAFCVYLFFKTKRSSPQPFFRKLSDMICLHSYGIYLSHLLILNIFLRLNLNFHFIHPLLSIPLITAACLIISCTLIIVMKKIPILKMLAG